MVKIGVTEQKGGNKMDLFEQIGEALVSAGKDVSQKAKDVSGIAKLKLDIRSKEDYIQKQYTALGADYYSKHKDDDACEEQEQIYLIKEAQAEIDRMKEELLKQKGAIQCPKCGTTVPDGAAFCYSCGAKLHDMFEDE